MAGEAAEPLRASVVRSLQEKENFGSVLRIGWMWLGKVQGKDVLLGGIASAGVHICKRVS